MQLSEATNDATKSQDSLEDQDENDSSENEIDNDDIDVERNVTAVSCFDFEHVESIFDQLERIF
jgi:hypothetical protein